MACHLLCNISPLQIQFDGDECHALNFSYFAAFASAFFFLALVCLVQLVTCIVAEWQRMKAPSLLRACRITTQKVLYFVVFLAAMIRGAYFTAPVSTLSIYLSIFYTDRFDNTYLHMFFLYRMQCSKDGPAAS